MSTGPSPPWVSRYLRWCFIGSCFVKLIQGPLPLWTVTECITCQKSVQRVSNHKRWSPVPQFRDRGGISASVRPSIFGIEAPPCAEIGFRDLLRVKSNLFRKVGTECSDGQRSVVDGSLPGKRHKRHPAIRPIPRGGFGLIVHLGNDVVDINSNGDRVLCINNLEVSTRGILRCEVKGDVFSSGAAVRRRVPGTGLAFGFLQTASALRQALTSMSLHLSRQTYSASCRKGSTSELASTKELTINRQVDGIAVRTQRNISRNACCRADCNCST
jgi:hypothetical protein